jgi:hypothetical protein
VWFTGYDHAPAGALSGFIGRLTPAAPGPLATVTLGLDRLQFAGGQTMRLAATLTPGTAPSAAVDVYIVLQLPGGDYASLQANGAAVPGVVPILRSVVPSALHGELRLPLTGLEPAGSYQWLAALTPAGALRAVDLIGLIAQYPFAIGP